MLACLIVFPCLGVVALVLEIYVYLPRSLRCVAVRLSRLNSPLRFTFFLANVLWKCPRWMVALENVLARRLFPSYHPSSKLLIKSVPRTHPQGHLYQFWRSSFDCTHNVKFKYSSVCLIENSPNDSLMLWNVALVLGISAELLFLTAGRILRGHGTPGCLQKWCHIRLLHYLYIHTRHQIGITPCFINTWLVKPTSAPPSSHALGSCNSTSQLFACLFYQFCHLLCIHF